MTAITKANVISATLGSVFVNDVAASISALGLSAFDTSRYAVFPGFCDVHVHFREPGFSYKETISLTLQPTVLSFILAFIIPFYPHSNYRC